MNYNISDFQKIKAIDTVIEYYKRKEYSEFEGVAFDGICGNLIKYFVGYLDLEQNGLYYIKDFIPELYQIKPSGMLQFCFWFKTKEERINALNTLKKIIINKYEQQD